MKRETKDLTSPLLVAIICIIPTIYLAIDSGSYALYLCVIEASAYTLSLVLSMIAIQSDNKLVSVMAHKSITVFYIVAIIMSLQLIIQSFLQAKLVVNTLSPFVLASCFFVTNIYLCHKCRNLQTSLGLKQLYLLRIKVVMNIILMSNMAFSYFFKTYKVAIYFDSIASVLYFLTFLLGLKINKSFSDNFVKRD